MKKKKIYLMALRHVINLDIIPVIILDRKKPFEINKSKKDFMSFWSRCF